MEKAPAEKMEDLGVLRSILRKDRAQASFMPQEGDRARARGNRWLQTAGHQQGVQGQS